jgi:hypothetical protein
MLISSLLITPAAPRERAAAGVLRLATFQCDVTPPLGELLYVLPLATIEHPLLAKGVILDDGAQRIVLCAVDWCTMRNATHTLFQTKVAIAATTKRSHVAIHCVHQHTAPSHDASAQELLNQQENRPQNRDLESLDEITDRLAAAVRQATSQLQPFNRVGIGTARVDRVASMRRIFDEEDTLHTRWSACHDPELRAMPEGDIDPLIRTVTLARDDQPLVRMHYYAVHPQSYYRDGRASYDFPGIARERLQRDEAVFQIYFTGCSGDVTAGKYNNGSRKSRTELAARLFAGMKAATDATTYSPVDAIAHRVLPVALKPRNDGKYDPEANRATLADALAKPQDRIAAASRLACYERLLQPIEFSLLRIGPARLLHLPGEPTVTFQHFTQQQLPGAFVAVAGYGLGTPGYICTERAFREGGYEPSASAIVPESEESIREAIRELLK